VCVCVCVFPSIPLFAPHPSMPVAETLRARPSAAVQPHFGDRREPAVAVWGVAA
jgi:hypothetical protein